ncbi:sugar ABC transporter permease [Clostridium sp. chh4-2]|uniref:carbohydrate ABC transporter permease n=1 Tax=Clostridium sp. chh4-2 TaxID=2067550 RepID=UPI0015E1679A|nr:sugar ABC transporter permease [Clostridium sp. chh4-2]
MKNKTKLTMTGYVFLAPALIIFIIFVLIPVITSIILAFTKWNFFSGVQGLKFIGLRNFKKLFTSDRSFMTALINTIVYAVATVPATVFFALIFAHIVNGRVYFQRFFRLAFFVPYISNLVALGAVFKFLFRSDGPINQILTHVFHVQNVPDWLVSTSLCRIPIICVMVYSGIGFCLIVYIAALKNVPMELYEAARVDGASAWKQFSAITVPMISPTTFYLIIVRLINAFQVFAAINIISDGGKSSGSVSLVVLVYEEAFKNYNFGYASAEAWILVIFILAVTLVNFGLQKKWVHY